MSSLKLSTRLDQRMVLTPQLRQRIEMLQMNSLELSELVQNEIIANPILEEVGNDEEIQEISEKILDQNSDGVGTFEVGADPSSNGSLNGDGNYEDSINTPISENSFEDNFNEDYSGQFETETDNSEISGERVDAFEEIDFGREFRDYLDPGYKTQEIEHKEDAPSFEQFLTRSESLLEHLDLQLKLQSMSDELEDICAEIIGNLDGDGRLIATDEEIGNRQN